MSVPVTPTVDVPASAWAPLRLAAFRSLWLAVLASNVGTWMQVPSWEEHLHQHGGRLTVGDQVAEERARALVEGEPEVTHLLPADPED